MSAREDIRTYYREGLNETSELFEKCSKVALSKGVFTRAPFIAYPTKTDYVNSNKVFKWTESIKQQTTVKRNRSFSFIYEHSNESYGK